MSLFPAPWNSWRRWGVAVAVLALLAAACGGTSPAALTGIVREPAPDVGGVVLPDEANGGRDFVTEEGDPR
jgi:hypothetical protein